MKILNFLSLLLVLGAGYVIYERRAAELAGDESPAEIINTITIEQRLQQLVRAEQRYLAVHGTFGTIAQLSEEELPTAGEPRSGYTFSAVVTRTGFTITATPVAPEKEGWPILEITENMQVTER